MPFSDAAFRYVPALKDFIKTPEHSRFRLTYARFDEMDTQAIKEGWKPGWRMSHEAREANRHQTLAGRLDRDLWVFAYGSLIWDPAIYVDEIRLATLTNWHRRFCMRIFSARGTPDRPGLTTALDEGGVCNGVAFRIPRDIVDQETEVLWMREMFADAYVPCFVNTTTPQGELTALTFVINRQNERYLPDISLTSAAENIAEAEGEAGTNFEYLDLLCTHLAKLELEDAELVELHRLTIEMQTRNGLRDINL